MYLDVPDGHRVAVPIELCRELLDMATMASLNTTSSLLETMRVSAHEMVKQERATRKRYESATAGLIECICEAATRFYYKAPDPPDIVDAPVERLVEILHVLRLQNVRMRELRITIEKMLKERGVEVPN